MTELQMQELLEQSSTPIYVFDIPVLRERVQYLRQRLPADVSLCYAMKANPFVVGELSDAVDRFEVCSPGEYHICQQLGVPSKQLVISGVYKSKEDTWDMVSRCPDMTFTAESLSQFQLLNQAAVRSRKKLHVLLRLTSGNQFGMEESILKELIRIREEFSNLHICGIQYFSGTQKHSVRKLKKELDRLALLLETLETEYGYQAEVLEFGPGLPVYYFQSEEFDEDAFLAAFSTLLEPLICKTKITLELGRSIAACCGTYLTKVVDTKTNQGQNYAILDGGIHHLVYYGQTMAMKLPHYQLIPSRNEAPELWNLCGSLCTVNDILVKQLPVPRLEIGDVFAFEQTGAYSMTEGISLFLSRDLPQVVFRMENGQFQPARDHIPTYPINTPNHTKENK